MRQYPPLLRTVFAGRCPDCGEGRLFSGLLALHKQCAYCGLSYSDFDSADGPAVFVILIVGFIVAGGALGVELAYAPKIWVHILLWVPLTLILSLSLLRLLKGLMIALQHRHDAREGQLANNDDQ